MDHDHFFSFVICSVVHITRPQKPLRPANRHPAAPFEEQERIADILSTLDREIALLRDYLDALKKQKRGLMQLLLTGKLRVRPETSGG